MTQAIDASTERFGLKQTVIEQISHVLAIFPEVERAVLYGSRAKGKHKPGSDIDLALMGDQLTESRMLELETRLDDLLLPYKLDLCRFHALQNQSLIDHINRVGKDFFRRQPKSR
jgi:predicted nucleotidyltransferase